MSHTPLAGCEPRAGAAPRPLSFELSLLGWPLCTGGADDRLSGPGASPLGIGLVTVGSFSWPFSVVGGWLAAKGGGLEGHLIFEIKGWLPDSDVFSRWGGVAWETSSSLWRDTEIVR